MVGISSSANYTFEAAVQRQRVFMSLLNRTVRMERDFARNLDTAVKSSFRSFMGYSSLGNRFGSSRFGAFSSINGGGRGSLYNNLY